MSAGSHSKKRGASGSDGRLSHSLASAGRAGRHGMESPRLPSSSASRQHARPRLERGRVPRAAWVLCALLVAVGVALLAAPALARALRTPEESAVSQASSESDDEEAEASWEAARRYNDALAGSPSGSVLPYEEQLEYGGNDVVAEVAVDSLRIELPVRKGASEENLAAGAAHVEGTALPVGGEGCTCVISAHSGLARAAMFDRLREAREGMDVELSVCGRTLRYEISQVEVLEQDAALECYEPVEGEDRLVLLTCTGVPSALFPRGAYGSNERRLVVTCVRAEDSAEGAGREEGASPPAWLPAAGAASVSALGLAAGVCIWRRVRRERGLSSPRGEN